VLLQACSFRAERPGGFFALMVIKHDIPAHRTNTGSSLAKELVILVPLGKYYLDQLQLPSPMFNSVFYWRNHSIGKSDISRKITNLGIHFLKLPMPMLRIEILDTISRLLKSEPY
jgi:hypothetical protein